MLAIRLQRLGRKGYATYRLAVQEAQRHPSSGRVVAYVGSYNPHTKAVTVQVEAAQKYLDNGAQPTPRVVKLLKDAGVKLPKWVVESKNDKTKAIRDSEKLRRNRPAEEAPEVVEEATEAPEEPIEAASAVEEGAADEVATETVDAVPAEETPAEEPVADEKAE
jgi:small subunit ribosomal protein S16